MDHSFILTSIKANASIPHKRRTDPGITYTSPNGITAIRGIVRWTGAGEL